MKTTKPKTITRKYVPRASIAAYWSSPEGLFRPGEFEGLPVQDVVFDRSGETFGGPYSASRIGAKHAWSLIRTCINEWRQGQRKAK